ncbi:type II toxin-antitoxin system RelE/ParE family toxin [Parapusillimonas sp. JC17]|uniref:type II toxin-antitoxin system RelE/ParE family toxin n=1 Tax=Parapusillimonas sp. JC17 TaxID=3445768 RepID=UPI003FA15A89
MTTKPVVLRDRARQDIDAALVHLVSQGTPASALAFIDKLQQAPVHVARHPATGSTRYAHELDLPGLRFWQLRRHPYLIFYVEHDDHIDVWRVLHGSQDIPRWMQESDQA